MWATYFSNLYISCNAESLPTESGRIDALSTALVLHTLSIVNSNWRTRLKLSWFLFKCHILLWKQYLKVFFNKWGYWHAGKTKCRTKWNTSLRDWFFCVRLRDRKFQTVSSFIFVQWFTLSLIHRTTREHCLTEVLNLCIVACWKSFTIWRRQRFLSVF